MKTRTSMRITGVIASAILLGLVQFQPAQAAMTPLLWIFGETEDGGSVNVYSGEEFDGSFRTETISGTDDVKIILNNYHGQGFHMACRGTCNGSPNKVIVELIGENEIEAEGAVGISTSVPVEFTGEGVLKIRALVPIGYGSEEGCLYTKDESYCSTMAEVLRIRMREDLAENANAEMIIDMKAAYADVSTGIVDEKPDLAEAATNCDKEMETGVAPIWLILGGFGLGAVVAALIMLVIVNASKHKNKTIEKTEISSASGTDDGKNGPVAGR